MMRVGSGFDVHRLAEERSLILCGVKIEAARGLAGHSDADVALHAITDAILGAIADGDIGSHFPPSEMRWKDVDSAVFLRHAVDLVTARGGRVAQIDLTILAADTALADHGPAMRTRLAEITGTPRARVVVKVRGHDGLGFAGRDEGLAAQAAVTTHLPG